MNIKISSLLALCALTVVLLVSGCASNTVSLPVTANFGNPPKGGGACIGKGLCSAVAPTPGTETSGVAATMQVSATDKNVLVITLSLAELKKKQPQQAELLNERTTTYDFDGSFDLTDKMYAPLKLAAGARIDQKSKSKVEVKGDVVTMSYNYSHN